MDKEIKVGQWARASALDGVKITKIIGVEQWSKLTKGYVLKDCDGLYLEGASDILKTADNIEELLEVGDIVEIQNEFNCKYIKIIDTDTMRLLYKEGLKRGNTKLIRIILHENLQWQEVNHE